LGIRETARTIQPPPLGPGSSNADLSDVVFWDFCSALLIKTKLYSTWDSWALCGVC